MLFSRAPMSTGFTVVLEIESALCVMGG